MIGRNHLLFGFATSIPIAIAIQENNITLPILFTYFLIIYVYSILPDIDISTSKISRLFPFFNIFLYKIEHRGVTHKPLFAIISTLILFLFFYTYMNESLEQSIYYWIVALVSISTHIIGDGMTVMGVPNFINGKTFHALPRRNRFLIGSIQEQRIGTILFIIVVIECVILKAEFISLF